MAVQKNNTSKGKKALAGTRKKALKVSDMRGEKVSSMKEVALNIGSQSSGAGAGKVTFNPFSITRK
jgi:ribosomal protein L32